MKYTPKRLEIFVQALGSVRLSAWTFFSKRLEGANKHRGHVTKWQRVASWHIVCKHFWQQENWERGRPRPH